ncbi:hypothetical protein MGH68_04705 [Erysipelothrix sp. D19-032]
MSPKAISVDGKIQGISILYSKNAFVFDFPLWTIRDTITAMAVTITAKH